jgi:2-polyprenyl-3-methyl-5-hydroxy-6-metoxy-1,4-benzoquinol methylase
MHRPNALKAPDLERIAAHCAGRWEYYYTRSKLRTDPVYKGVLDQVYGTAFPILDIGCGIGLLAHYLHASGHEVPITGFDYDASKIRSAQLMARRANIENLNFSAGDARQGLPEFSGHVVILDILQFFTEAEQNALLTAAASRVAPGAALIIRSGIQDDSWRFRLTVMGDYLAKISFWMKAAPTRYPDPAQFKKILTAAGLQVSLTPMWGKTPFNNHLIVGKRAA